VKTCGRTEVKLHTFSSLSLPVLPKNYLPEIPEPLADKCSHTEEFKILDDMCGLTNN
jgi:hypothetical protein